MSNEIESAQMAGVEAGQDFAIFQNHDDISIAYGRKAMGNYKGSSVFHQPVHTVFNVTFRSGIY